MARPFKTGPKMDVDLRIPVTSEQRDLVRKAASLLEADMAAWIRPLILKAAQQVVDKHEPAGKRKSR
jgi:uncharacterized protein (DUF1778 family)